MAGIPEEIIQRARMVSAKLGRNEPVEKLNSVNMKEKKKQYMKVIEKFQILFSKEDFDQNHIMQFMEYIRGNVA